MTKLITAVLSSLNQSSDQPSVRIRRVSGHVFKSMILFFPANTGAGNKDAMIRQYPMREVGKSHFEIVKDQDEHQLWISGPDRREMIASFSNAAQAQAFLKEINASLNKTRFWMYAIALGVIGFFFLGADAPSTSVVQAAKSQPTAAKAQMSAPAPMVSQRVIPSAAPAQPPATAQLDVAPAAQTDANDPFGLRINPARQ